MVHQHFLGKEKAGGSSPPVGSILFQCEAADDKVEWRFSTTQGSKTLKATTVPGGQVHEPVREPLRPLDCHRGGGFRSDDDRRGLLEFHAGLAAIEFGG